ncbi:MAG: hypothetical protein HRU19_27425 [Pseudobacteriovorax sp.]|nr:hypothetical protein [Pseudobacteriovorax sp.]
MALQQQVDKVADILVTSESSGECLRRLYESLAAEKPQFSMNSVSDKIGIKSRGYLSWVFSGKRVLHPKYFLSTANFFQLTGLRARILELLIFIDRTRKDSERERYDSELADLRKALGHRRSVLPPRVKNICFALEVLGVIGLHQEPPTREQLLKSFQRDERIGLDDAIHSLLHFGMLEKSPTGQLQMSENTQVLIGQNGGVTHIEFLETSLADTLETLEHWYHRPEEAVVETHLIGVKQSELKTIAAKIRDQVNVFCDELEDQKPDTLVRLNLSIHPVRSRDTPIK